MQSQIEALEPKMERSAPTLESSLFAHKRGKPIPIVVGHTTALDMVYATQQLWVGTENGLMGSVYVFNLPDMCLHHHLHLQDAVLSLCALNGCGVHNSGDEMKYRVLLGLANGTIILSFGINQGKVIPNPLQGPKLQMFTTGRKPSLNMGPTSNGYIWCNCGDSLELLDIVNLKSLRKLDALVVAVGGSETPRGLRKGEVIMLMATNALGVWTVTRRSTLLRLWDAVDWSHESQLQRQVSVVVCVVHVHVWCMLSFIKLTNEANGTLGPLKSNVLLTKYSELICFFEVVNFGANRLD